MIETYLLEELKRVFKKYEISHNLITNTIIMKSLTAEAEMTSFIDEANQSIITCVIYNISKPFYKECSDHKSVNDLIHYLTFAMVSI